MTKVALYILWVLASFAFSQLPPSAKDLNGYRGLFAAVSENNLEQITQLLHEGANLEERDTHERTPLLVAAHLGQEEAARLLLEAGADPNALERQRYDLITIAAVNNDVDIIQLGLEYGANPANITSPYDGTALIAAAHLGHIETVQALIAANAPLDHVNNLGWTALIEAIVLGDGGHRHTEVLRALVEAGADVNLAERSGKTPLELATERSFQSMIDILVQADAKP